MPKYSTTWPMNMQQKLAWEFEGTKVMKISPRYYDSPASLEKYIEREFRSNMPIKGYEELTACQIHSSCESLTQKISLSGKNIVEFRVITLKARFTAHIGSVSTP